MILITFNGKAMHGSSAEVLVERSKAIALNKFLDAWFIWYAKVQKRLMDPVRMARAALLVKKELAQFDKGNT